MSDPLSVSASIIAVLQLTTAATNYIKDVKHGSAERLRLRDELRSTACILEMLKDRIDDSNDFLEVEVVLKPPAINSLVGPDGPIAQFKKLLEDIIAKLAPQDRLRQLSQPFRWPFDKKAVEELLNSMERLKSYFSLVMQNDLAKISKLSNLKIEEVSRDIKESKARDHEEQVQKIILWISPISYSSRHYGILESVQPGTGAWLVENETFRSWVAGNLDVLWCPGIPGAGKTTLVSLIIDHVERKKSPESLCAYIYCDYNRRDEQTSLTLLSSLLQQILQQMAGETLPAQVSSLYDLHKKYNTRPTVTQIIDLLRLLVSRCTIFYVVVDALDECAGSEDDALLFLSATRFLGPQIKVLCTSRFSTTFGNYFRNFAKIEISANDGDISIFLETQIQQQRKLSKHAGSDPSLKKDIIDTIVEESQGMFLLAKLHIESLSQKITRKDVRVSLRSLPTTLDATDSDTLGRIRNQAPEAANLGELVLYWVLCSKRQLTVPELQHIYATHNLSEEAALENDDLPDADIITSACGGLVIVDDESNHLRPVHYTAQQYFQRCQEHRLSEAHTSLANISLAYLTLPNFSTGVCKDDVAMSQRLSEYPFLDYAAKFWGSDMRESEMEIFSSLQKLASNPTAIEMTNQVATLQGIRHSREWSQEFPRGVPILVLAASFDLPKTIRRLVLEGHDIEGKGSDGDTALIRSSGSGQLQNVHVLLELGASIDTQDHMNETALQRASRNGQEEIVRLLLNGGADVNVKASSGWTVLMSAVSSGNIRIVQTLVQANAVLADTTVWGDSALSIAIRDGQEAIATVLADNGAILPPGSAGRRASIAASRRGLQHLVRRLTANYKTVAGRPLQRQSSRIMGGLEGILEEADGGSEHPLTVAANDDQSTENEEPDFSDVMEGLDYLVGFSRRYILKHSIVKIFAVNKRNMAQPLIDMMRREVYFMREIRRDPHPNLIQMVDLFAQYAERTISIYLVQELGVDGELYNYIVAKKRLTESESRTVFSQLFSAVDFLHNRGWIHRDIKPENIIITDEFKLTVKLCDFGLAKEIQARNMDVEMTTTLCGTPSYVAPEVLAEFRFRRYGFSVDVWSCGVVLYICLCGFPPFSDQLYSKDFPYTLSQQIKDGRFDYPSPFWDPVGDPALDLIDNMLVVEAANRFNIKQCRDHPWMQDTSPTILTDNIRTASPTPLMD